MCNKCRDIILRDSFYSPRDYANCLAYIQSLITEKNFEMLESTCPIDNVKSENGGWYTDIITHTIQCKKCGQLYICFCDTYHGKGSFKKK